MNVLAALGGFLIILGGVVGFLLSAVPARLGDRLGSDSGAAVAGFVAVVLGLIVLLFSGYTQYRGASSSLTGGIILVVLGAVSWAVVGDWFLVAIGSVLAILAGLILSVEALLGQSRSRTTR